MLPDKHTNSECPENPNGIAQAYSWTRLITLISFTIVASACHPGSPPRPLDIIARDRDPNGYPLNPHLGAQVDPDGTVKLAGDGTVELAPEISQLPCIPPDQGDVDNAHWADAWYNGDSTCTHYHVTKNTGPANYASLFGHVNWFPVTVHGNIYWDEHSTQTKGPIETRDKFPDDDYSFNIATQDNALGSLGHMLSIEGKITAVVHSEFDSDEAIDPLLDGVDPNDPFWWKQFKNAVDYDDGHTDSNTAGPLLGGKKALDGERGGDEVIAIGLYNLDCYHPCGIELHPLYILAIHLQSDPRADRWALLAFNNGNQGANGDDTIGLDSNNGANAKYDDNDVDEQYSVLLPVPQGASGNAPVFTHKDVRVVLGSGKPIDAVAPKYFDSTFLQGKGEKLDFRLRYPEKQNDSDHYVIMGDITLDWGSSTEIPY